MNDLAGRLNKMPGGLFSLFMHGKRYCYYLVQPEVFIVKMLVVDVCK